MADNELMSGSGSASLLGYLYQLDVSVWLALDLMVATRQTDRITLEPATQEDLEARIEETEPGRLVSQASLASYNLIVQAKRRDGDAWTPKTLRSLLHHGSEGRVSAATRLANASNRYLLITSAGLNGHARRLGRRRPGSWPGDGAVPSVVAASLAHDISGRLAVIAGADDERLGHRIDDLLTASFRVPYSRLTDCRRKLREDALTRACGAGGGVWRRRDVEDVIRSHDGYLASAPELENYVYPTNWADLRTAMNRHSAAVIIGTSGTGKTLATRKLFDELSEANPGLTRVPVVLGPQQLLNDQTAGPVLFDVEDPWGRFDFDPASRPWNNLLPGILAAARPDRMVIVTSRSDVGLASGALGKVKEFAVTLEAENYGPAERSRLYRTRISALRPDLRALALKSEDVVLAVLATPYEIQRFFDALALSDQSVTANSDGMVRDAIATAHRDAIEDTVIEQIEQRGDIAAAAVLYALLSGVGRATHSVLRPLEDGFGDAGVDLGRGIGALTEVFVAARNLRLGDGGILSYYHPRVEAGVLRALEKPQHRQTVRIVLRKLIDLVVAHDGSDSGWGAGTAARITAEVRDRFGISPSPRSWARIDAWLEDRLTAPGTDFDSDIDLAARAGSAACNAAEIARFLRHRPDPRFGGFTTWGPPEFSEEWYTARRSEPGTHALLDHFVKTSLGRDGVHYPASLAAELSRLADGLTPAFIDAASVAVHHGYLASDDAIAEGALDDLEAFEEIVDTAVRVIASDEAGTARAAEIRLDIANEVYSDDYAQHLSENDDGHTAWEFLGAYARRLRRERGWKALIHHRHGGVLRAFWVRILVEEGRAGRADDEEVAGAFDHLRDTDEEDDLWFVVSRVWNKRYLSHLLAAIASDRGNADVLPAALGCLLSHAPTELAPLVGRLRNAGGGAERLVAIARALALLERGSTRYDDCVSGDASAAIAALPRALRNVARAESALLASSKVALSREAAAYLASIEQPSDDLRWFRLALDGAVMLASEGDVRRALAVADSPAVVVDAVDAAVRRGMKAEIEAALDHRFAHPAARALEAIADARQAPLPARLRAMAGHRGSPVRRALATELKAKPHDDHVSTLLTLAADRWTRDSMGYGRDDDVFPIARIAVEALPDADALGEDARRELFRIAVGCSDRVVRRAILVALARRGGGTWVGKLLRLALDPGRRSVRTDAATALLEAPSDQLLPLTHRFTAELLLKTIEPVAAVLAVLLGSSAPVDHVLDVGASVAADPDRRSLTVLVAWMLVGHDDPTAAQLAAMLPAGHPAGRWALEGGDAEDAILDGLGDPMVCSEVLDLMRLR